MRVAKSGELRCDAAMSSLLKLLPCAKEVVKFQQLGLDSSECGSGIHQHLDFQHLLHQMLYGFFRFFLLCQVAVLVVTFNGCAACRAISSSSNSMSPRPNQATTLRPDPKSLRTGKVVLIPIWCLRSIQDTVHSEMIFTSGRHKDRGSVLGFVWSHEVMFGVA